MEGRFRRLFLISMTCWVTSLAATTSYAQDNDENKIDSISSKDVLDEVISPDIKRRTIKEAKIDNENFEISVFGGVMSVEDFASNDVFGGRLAYHLSEDFFLEVSSGKTETSLSSFELLLGSNPRFVDRELSYYNLSLGINLLPGEVYLGENFAFNTNYYVVFGAGNTKFAENEYLTYNFGAGLRMFTTDWLAVRVDFRHHLFDHTIFGPSKSVQNLEATMGLSLYF